MLRLSAILFIFSTLLACNSRERAAKIIRKKAQEQARMLVSPAQVCIETELKKMECVIAMPSLSESIAEKTELISSW